LKGFAFVHRASTRSKLLASGAPYTEFIPVRKATVSNSTKCCVDQALHVLGRKGQTAKTYHFAFFSLEP
jgi:hypothetical protein